MKSGKVVELLFILPGDSTRQVRMKGHYSQEELVVISDLIKTTNFETDELTSAVRKMEFKVGSSHSLTEFLTWAVAAGYLMFIESSEHTPPFIISEALNIPTDTIVTLTFAGNIDKVGDATALKAGIQIATDGSTFAALAAADAVTDINGTGNTLIITFDSALTTATNKIKILAGTIKNKDGIENTELITNAIDAS